MELLKLQPRGHVGATCATAVHRATCRMQINEDVNAETIITASNDKKTQVVVAKN